MMVALNTEPWFFALLDDGCNRICHAPARVCHADAVLGQDMGPMFPHQRLYKDLGNVRTVGKRRVPLLIRVSNNRLLRGDVI